MIPVMGISAQMARRCSRLKEQPTCVEMRYLFSVSRERSAKLEMLVAVKPC